MNQGHEMGPAREAGERKWKTVYTIVEQANSEKRFWLRIGVAFVNRDQSLTVRLDAMPVNGTLHIREDRYDESRPRRSEGAPSFAKQRELV